MATVKEISLPEDFIPCFTFYYDMTIPTAALDVEVQMEFKKSNSFGHAMFDFEK